MKKPKLLKLTSQEADDLLKRVADSPLSKRDYEIIKGLMETVLVLNQALDQKVTSIKRLLKMLFGAKTEKSKNILKNTEESEVETSSDTTQDEEEDKDKSDKKNKPKGHGRNGASSYKNAERKKVSHESLKSGDSCPSCEDGKVYRLIQPGVVVRITGETPIQATVYELEKLRCNLCLKIFTAQAPPEAGSKKYDEAAGAMIALLRYGGGFPFYRLEKFQEMFGVPLPDSTQWYVVEKVANHIYPAFEELIRQAAQGKILHHDDTKMTVLQLIKEIATGDKKSRKGVFTTGFVSIIDGRKIALFFTGRNHAGENMADVLAQREKGLPLPIQMCDALSRNMSKKLKTLLAKCMAHARRNFVDVVDNFPEECRFVIETFSVVYKNDGVAEEKNMSDEERLAFHKTESAPVMEGLYEWCKQRFSEKTVEPNSGLGNAITYLLDHWKELTLFLKVAGAPLDNNICERALKKAIIHRKNSLFYKTELGAYVGDLFMSLIYTCKLSEINPFEYLKALQKYSSHVFKTPQDWMPWNYQDAVTALAI